MPRIYLASSALEKMVEAAEGALPLETGGILVGYRVSDDVRVERAPVVRDDRASGHSYNRSHDDAQRLLDEEIKRDPGAQLLGWVGEWHSHPESSGPTRRDLRELSRLAREDGHAVALIVLIRGKFGWIPDGRVAARRLARRARMEIGLGVALGSRWTTTRDDK